VPTPSRSRSLRTGAINRYANRTAPGEVARWLGWHCGHTVRSEHSGWRSGEPDPGHCCDQFIKGDVRDPSVRQTQPLVTVRSASERTPRGLIFGLSDGPQRFAGGRESVSDVPVLAERGVNQDEPKVRLIRVQRDTAGGPVRVVVRMREHAGEGPVTHNPQYRPKTSLQQRGDHDDQRPHLHTDRPARRQDCHGPGRRANPCLLAQQPAANIRSCRDARASPKPSRGDYGHNRTG